MKSIDEAINNIVSSWNENFVLIRIQDLAREMHRHYFKNRDRILKEIREWVKEHPSGSIWVDEHGTKWKVGYGQQMHPRYGYFKDGYDMLELLCIGKMNEESDA